MREYCELDGLVSEYCITSWIGECYEDVVVCWVIVLETEVVVFELGGCGGELAGLVDHCVSEYLYF